MDPMTDDLRDALEKRVFELDELADGELVEPGEYGRLGAGLAPHIDRAFEKIAQAAADEHNRTLTNPAYFNSADVAEFKAAGIAALRED